MDTNNCSGKKRKRERKKCKRRKINVPALSTMDTEWDVPDVRLLLHKSEPSSSTAKQLNSSFLTGEALIGSKCVKFLSKININILSHLFKEAQLLSTKFQRIRLRRVLQDNVPRYAHRRTSYLISHPLSRRQLDAYTAKLFLLMRMRGENCLLDQENFDCFRANIVQAFSDFRTSGPIMSRKEICRNIRYNRVRWLQGVPFRLKEAIVNSLLKSLLNLFTRIFSTHFYSTLNSAGRIVHYRRDVWRRITIESFDLLRAERKFQMLESSTGQTVKHVHRIRFLPKKHNTRPIVILSDPNVKRLLAEVRAVLRYTMSKQPHHFGWGIPSIRLFQFAYRRFLLKHKHEHRGEQVHFCSADLQNCYTSLEHEFLEKLLQNTFPVQCTYKVLTAPVRNSLHGYTRMRTAAGANYFEAFGRLQCKRNEQIVGNPVVVQLTGADILERVRQFTMQTIIKMPSIIDKKRRLLFRCNRGIAQGNQLSVSLCNLYLGAMERGIFRERPRNVLCRRYVDDYIMMAYRKEDIEQVMEPLLAKASAKYGLAFGKIVASFRGAPFLQQHQGSARPLKRGEKMAWCGFALNTRTLSISLDYRRYLHGHHHQQNKFPPNLHPSEHSNWICKETRRALKGRMLMLRNSNRIWPAKRRLALKRRFCHFAYTHYLKHFVRQLCLNEQHRPVRLFMEEVVRWIFRSFVKRSTPKAISG